MGLFGNMKGRLGFGDKPEWQDDENYDGEKDYDQGYDEAYDDGQGSEYDDDNQGDLDGNVVSFDAYNPNTFEHVTFSSDRRPEVAAYDPDSPRAARNSYSKAIGSSARRSYGDRDAYSGSYAAFSRGAAGVDWDAPDEPSFLDSDAPASRNESVSSVAQKRDQASSLGADFLELSGSPATRLEIVRPVAYADVEKVANAAKAGKTVVLAVVDTKPTLAKRILDFSFGVASALNLNVDKEADRVFVIAKSTRPLSDEERSYLKKQGVL